MAQNDEIVEMLFELYMTKSIDTTFDTIMYGKPVYIREIIDIGFNKKYRKLYRLKCIIDGKESVISIPNAFPTFFPKGK